MASRTRRGLLALGALLLLPAWGAPPPNLLFILLDDFGWNDAGYHNGGRPNEGWTSTPTLDRLAASGVKLESYYTAPICSPSRAQIMTGRYQIRVGIQHGCYGASQGTGLPLDEVTIADALSRLDYETWMFGKWHLGFDEAAFLPTSRGFDYHYGHYDACVNAWNHTVGKTGTEKPRVVDEPGTHTCELLARDAVAKLAARDDARPLFVYLAFHMVHESDGAADGARSVASPDKPTKLLEAPEAYTAKFKDAGLNATRQTFLGMVALVDDAVGNVTDAWAAAGLGGVVVVASDNGSPHDARGFAGNLPLRGQKHELWEGGVRVPAFVFGAGVPRGAARRNVVAAVDWWPTLVKLAGGASSADASLDGVDLWPAVARGDDVRSELLHNFDTSSKPTAGFRGALRVGDLKLVLLEKHKQTLLYNVTADPREAADLAARRPGDAAALLAKLEAYGAAAVPCWGGTGPTPNPANFSGDCDAHPARSCETPAVYAPGWCG
ncbi:sulfuric ester hydrolase [Aureococcus anophagefferens]|uniref:Sulfuric ester hydrolase n=1 Tax=Aureococcus anophagefferens TaxID=44056 RepID=A0ABR1FSW1_AURAN